MQMSDQFNLDNFDRELDRLNNIRDAAVFYVTYLKDIADNGRWSKYGNSLAGNVVNMNVATAEHALILWCHKMWDNGNDVISVQGTVTQMNRNRNFFFNQYLQKTGKTHSEEGKSDWNEELTQVTSTKRTLEKGTVLRVLKVIRNENLAHNILECKTRTNKFPGGFDNHEIKRNDLFDFAVNTVNLIDRITYLRSGVAYEFEDTSGVFQIYCDAFWSAVPVFKDVEDD